MEEGAEGGDWGDDDYEEEEEEQERRLSIALHPPPVPDRQLENFDLSLPVACFFFCETDVDII